MSVYNDKGEEDVKNALEVDNKNSLRMTDINIDDEKEIASSVEATADNTDDDCIIQETNITTITINDTIIEPEKESPHLMKITFSDSNIFGNLHGIVFSAIKSSLKFQKIDIEMIEDHKANTIMIQKKDGEENEFFTVDIEPANDINAIQTIEVPNYEKFTETTLTEKDPEAPIVNTAPKRKRNVCFNCGDEGHIISECTEPKNLGNIKRLKQEFQSKYSNERYHTDIQQRFGHFVPGKLSKELRKALGLRSDDLPQHIYNMRTFGYPPGWLEEARIQHSGIALIHADGEAMSDSDAEEGEVDADKSKYDIKKLYDYPGFNVFPDFKYNELSEYMRDFAPMQPLHMKEKMLDELKDRVVSGYKRKKLKNLSSGNSEPKIKDREVDDEDFIVIDSTEDESIVLNDSINQASIDELEKRKEKLLEDIRNSQTQSPLPNSALLDADVCVTPVNKNSEINSTKFEVHGTPLLQFSPYTKLPAGDNFSVGVSDVICFENLPDSTGKYEQMKVVIDKVRQAITELNDEE